MLNLPCKRCKETYSAVCGIADELGWALVDVRQRKHIVVTFERRGTRRKLTLAQTPKRNSHKNAVADAKRILR